MKKLLLGAVLAALAGLPALAQDSNGTTTTTETSPTTAPAAPAAEDPAVELTFWDSIKDSDNPDLFLAYMQRYPNGAFRVIAEARLKEIYSGGGDDIGEDDTDMAADGAEAAPTTQVITVQPAPAPAPTVRGVTRRDTAAGIQRQLRRLGCYRGAIDGIWGPQSRAAARRFNRSYSGTNIAVNNPNLNALSKLRSISFRVCP
jgi:Putative peptidoglycan binding domain